MDGQTAVYRIDPGHTAEIKADTCEPLKAAAADGELSLAAWTHGAYPGGVLPETVLPGLSSVGVWDAESDQRWGLAWHHNEGIELTFLLRGRIPFAVEDETTVLHPGQMTITRPWQGHRLGDPYVPASTLVWFILDVGVRRPNQEWTWPEWLLFSPWDQATLTSFLRQNERPVWSVGRAVRDRFQLLADTLQHDDIARVLTRTAVCINDVLLEVMDHFSARQIPRDPVLCSTRRSVSLFLQNLGRYCAEPWTIDRMAEQCGLGRSQFALYCKEITNRTPLDYLNDKRIEVARRELSIQPGKSVTQIAFDCGFNSSQYFATVFRNHTGWTPTRYRHSSHDHVSS